MIIATAGHVDHGKTSLIKQLTGVDTDRLEEEKRRGLSINLGFAYRTPCFLCAEGSLSAEGSLPAEGSQAETIGFIDVPGHQRFINTMIAGVSSIDLGMLVVAVDDGPMPQTIEHLNVMTLLGINNFLVVLSKIDKADNAQIKKVRESVLALLPEQCVKKALVFQVSNISNEGIDELQQHLDTLALSYQNKATQGFFRLSIDRAFSLKGAGLIVTGTVSSGEVSVGDNVKIFPKGLTLRVRSIHAQDKASETGKTGQRCALNIVGDIQKNEVERGDSLLGDGAGAPTVRFAARCELLGSSPISLKHMSPLKLYIGARHIAAKICLLEREKSSKLFLPGTNCLVQIITTEPVCCYRGERFLLRDDSESFTLGGGMVLDPIALPMRKLQAKQKEFLQAMEMPDFAQAVQFILLDKQRVIDFTLFKQSWNLRKSEADELLQKVGLLDGISLLEINQIYFALSKQLHKELKMSIVDKLQGWHKAYPEVAGIKSVELKNQFKKTDVNNIYPVLLNELLDEKKLALSAGLLRISNFSHTISAQDQKLWTCIREILVRRNMQIPLLSELSSESGLSSKQISSTVLFAAKSGHLFKVSDKRFALGETLLTLTAQVNILAQTKPDFSAVDFKNFMGIGRNYAIELLEYFDSIRFTQRRENGRIVLDESRPTKLFK